jgi:hypothetical protein
MISPTAVMPHVVHVVDAPGAANALSRLDASMLGSLDTALGSVIGQLDDSTRAAGELAKAARRPLVGGKHRPALDAALGIVREQVLVGTALVNDPAVRTGANAATTAVLDRVTQSLRSVHNVASLRGSSAASATSRHLKYVDGELQSALGGLRGGHAEIGRLHRAAREPDVLGALSAVGVEVPAHFASLGDEATRMWAIDSHGTDAVVRGILDVPDAALRNDAYNRLVMPVVEQELTRGVVPLHLAMHEEAIALVDRAYRTMDGVAARIVDVDGLDDVGRRLAADVEQLDSVARVVDLLADEVSDAGGTLAASTGTQRRAAAEIYRRVRSADWTPTVADQIRRGREIGVYVAPAGESLAPHRAGIEHIRDAVKALESGDAGVLRQLGIDLRRVAGTAARDIEPTTARTPRPAVRDVERARALLAGASELPPG